MRKEGTAEWVTLRAGWRPLQESEPLGRLSGPETFPLRALPPYVGRGQPWPAQRVPGEVATCQRLRFRSLAKGTLIQVEGWGEAKVSLQQIPIFIPRALPLRGSWLSQTTL